MVTRIDWTGPWDTETVDEGQRQLVLDAKNGTIVAGDWIALSDEAMTGVTGPNTQLRDWDMGMTYLHRKLGLVQAVEEISWTSPRGNEYREDIYKIRWGWTLDVYPNARYYRNELVLAPNILVNFPNSHAPYDEYGLYHLRGLWSYNLTKRITVELLMLGVHPTHLPTPLVKMFSPDEVP